MLKPLLTFTLSFVIVSALSNVLIGFIFALLLTGYIFGERNEV